MIKRKNKESIHEISQGLLIKQKNDKKCSKKNCKFLFQKQKNKRKKNKGKTKVKVEIKTEIKPPKSPKKSKFKHQNEKGKNKLILMK